MAANPPQAAVPQAAPVAAPGPQIQPFSKEFVRRLREHWTQPDFNTMFPLFYQSCQFHDVASRLQLEEVEGVQLALDVIRDEKDVAVVGRAWLILQNFVLVHRVDDPDEMKPIEIFVERGGVELAAVELFRPEPRWTQTILTALAWASTNEKVVPRVIASGVHKIGIQFVREQHPTFLDISMSFIRSASVARECRSTLRADGALEAFLPFISCNRSREHLMMRRGFRAASVVARLAGNDETGIGPSILRNNPDLIQTTLNVFQMVLDAGPDGTVINMLINPQFVTMDLLIISTADVNKPLLACSIPLCMKALRLRGEHNAPMVSDIVKLFLQLSFDPTCKSELNKHAMDLFDLLSRLVPTPQQLRSLKSAGASATPGSSPATLHEHDAETIMAAQMLRSALMSQQTPSAQLRSAVADLANPANSFMQGIVRRIVPSATASRAHSGSTTESIPELDSVRRPWVIISYSWHSSDLAKRLDELLRFQNVRVWIDYRCMDGSPSESMENAAKEAGAMIMLLSAHYKESAVCRKEAELAEEYQLPILTVQAEDNYRPDGWLALILAAAAGRNQSLPGWTPALIKSSMSVLMKRLAVAAPACLLPKQSVSQASSPHKGSNMQSPSATTTVVYESDPRLLEALAALTASVNEMRSELNELKMEVRGLRSI